MYQGGQGTQKGTEDRGNCNNKYILKAVVPLPAVCRSLKLQPKGSTSSLPWESQLSSMTLFSCPKVVSYLKTTWFCPRDICISVFWLMTTGTRLCCMTSICSLPSALGLFRIGGKNKKEEGACVYLLCLGFQIPIFNWRVGFLFISIFFFFFLREKPLRHKIAWIHRELVLQLYISWRQFSQNGTFHIEGTRVSAFFLFSSHTPSSQLSSKWTENKISFECMWTRRGGKKRL